MKERRRRAELDVQEVARVEVGWGLSRSQQLLPSTVSREQYEL